jgi:hypothetical protein
MLGDGIVSFGVIDSPVIDFRNVKSSAKMVSRRRTGPSTCNAAALNSICPSAFWNFTLIDSSELLIPPSR